MKPKRTRKLLVFGNGPSLRGFDFARTDAVDTLGMNAAYRYWDRIGWYPNHYCCVDDQLIETHHAEIRRLIEDGQVETVFTLAKILEFQPAMANMEGVYFREQFHGQLAKRLGEMGSDKRYLDHPAFKPSNPKKLTTGAFAVRYGVFQGYDDIGLLGVDLDYVEILPEARAGDGLKLVIAEDVDTNPNYFFDDYQRKGDRYNVPNPEEHDGNLHVQAFEVLRDDLALQAIDARVVNLNPHSRLHDLGIFPFARPEAFLGETGIGAIAVPTTAFEVDDICRNIALWDLPAYHPITRQGRFGETDLVFIFSQPVSDEIRAQIEARWSETTHLKTMFSARSPVFLSADLDGEVDTYKREYVSAHGEAGFKSGPNLQFFASMRQLGDRYRDFVFYMETDNAPVRAGWLDMLDDMARGDGQSWVIGSAYRGVARLAKRFFLHLNGNALYRVGDPEFQAFLREEWGPLLMEAIETEDPRLAYDCVLSRHWATADSHQRNAAWLHYQAYGHRFRETACLLNISGEDDLAGCDGLLIQSVLSDHRDAVVIHGRQFTRALHAAIGETWVSPGTLRLQAIAPKGETRASEYTGQSPADYVLMPERGATKLGATRFRLDANGQEDGQLLIIFDARIDVGDTFTVDLVVNASTSGVGQVALGRHGRGAYEGTAEDITLMAGESRLHLSHTFERSHPRLRAQITLTDGCADLEIVAVALAVRQSWWPADMDFSEADEAAMASIAGAS